MAGAPSSARYGCWKLKCRPENTLDLAKRQSGTQDGVPRSLSGPGLKYRIHSASSFSRKLQAYEVYTSPMDRR